MLAGFGARLAVRFAIKLAKAHRCCQTGTHIRKVNVHPSAHYVNLSRSTRRSPLLDWHRIPASTEPLLAQVSDKEASRLPLPDRFRVTQRALYRQASTQFTDGTEDAVEISALQSSLSAEDNSAAEDGLGARCRVLRSLTSSRTTTTSSAWRRWGCSDNSMVAKARDKASFHNTAQMENNIASPSRDFRVLLRRLSRCTSRGRF